MDLMSQLIGCGWFGDYNNVVKYHGNPDYEKSLHSYVSSVEDKNKSHQKNRETIESQARNFSLKSYDVPVIDDERSNKANIDKIFADSNKASDSKKNFELIDGGRSIAEIIDLSGIAGAADIIRPYLGEGVDIASTIGALEKRVKSCEIVRIPPLYYAIDRNYWENMANVREDLN